MGGHAVAPIDSRELPEQLRSAFHHPETAPCVDRRPPRPPLHGIPAHDRLGSQWRLRTDGPGAGLGVEQEKRSPHGIGMHHVRPALDEPLGLDEERIARRQRNGALEPFERDRSTGVGVAVVSGPGVEELYLRQGRRHPPGSGRCAEDHLPVAPLPPGVELFHMPRLVGEEVGKHGRVAKSVDRVRPGPREDVVPPGGRRSSRRVRVRVLTAGCRPARSSGPSRRCARHRALHAPR